MLFLAQTMQLDLATMVAAGGALGVSLIVWLLRSRVETAETALQNAIIEVNECKVHRATMIARLDHLEKRMTRSEDAQ